MPTGVYKRTPEHVAAMSAAKKGISLSPEHCAAISAAKMGENNHMYGKKHSPEAITKMSDSHTGIILPPRTPEHRAALSEAGMGHTVSPDRRAAISKSLTGRHLSPEHIDAISESRTPEFCAIMSDAMKNSEASKDAVCTMIGGEDIVWHHTIYDHSDLSKNRVAMTRANHSMGHRMLQMIGIEIPHINMET